MSNKIILLLTFLIPASLFSLDMIKATPLSKVKSNIFIENQASYYQTYDSVLILKNDLNKLKSEFVILNEKINNVTNLIDLFLKGFAILLTITFSGAIVYTIISIKEIRKSYENKYKENFIKLTEESWKRIREIIRKEEIRNKLSTEKSILIINQKGTGMSKEFKMVLNTFKHVSSADINALKDALKLDYSKFDLVIIENFDENGRWEFSIIETDDVKTKKLKSGNMEMFIKLANLIASTTPLIYFGPKESGNFPTERTEKSAHHLISFSNTPATLYGNIIDLLIYKDIIDGVNIFDSSFN